MDADHYWDLNNSVKIVDSVTSQQGSSSGDVVVTRSIAGTGLRTEGLGQISIELDDCPVDPSRCNKGFAVSLCIKPTGATVTFLESRFLLGNSITDGVNGFLVDIFDKTLNVYVRTNDYVCSMDPQGVLANLWFHLGFSWKNPHRPGGGLKVYLDGKRINSHSVTCEKQPRVRSTRTKIYLGSNGNDEPGNEFDHLAIWYRNSVDVTAPWKYLKGKMLLL